MPFVSFYIGNPENYFKDPNDKQLQDIHSIRIQESSSVADGFTTIDTVKFQHGQNYVGTHKASDDYANRFYRLEFISDPSVDDPTTIRTYLRTEPILPEELATIVDDIRDWLGDTDINNPAFSDTEYLQAIKFALRQWRGDRNIAKIEDQDKYPIQLLVREQFANILAYDHAKYYELSTPTHKLNKWEIGAHFIEVAENYRKQFETYAKRLNMQSGGFNEDNIISQMPAVNVGTAKRFSRTGGYYITKREASHRRLEFFRPPSEV